MLAKFPFAAVLAAALSLASGAALAAATDYTFEPITAQVKKGMTSRWPCV